VKIPGTIYAEGYICRPADSYSRTAGNHEQPDKAEEPDKQMDLHILPRVCDVYGNIEAESSIMLLKKACMPEDIMRLGAEGINQIWREAKFRAVGIKRATSLYEAVKESIGISEDADAARH
jgi:hypothetical protein